MKRKFTTLAALAEAFKSGDIPRRAPITKESQTVVVDNDSVHLVVESGGTKAHPEYSIVFNMEPRDVIHEALKLLGIPTTDA